MKVARRSFFVPRPRFPSWEALNLWLQQQCRKRRERRQRGHRETIAERFERDRGALLPLPAVAYEAFEFPSLPSLNKSLVLELARSEYLDRRENVLALGNSGTGKTHLALALGLAACQKGYRVRFTTAAALVHELLEAGDDQRLLRLQKQLAKQDLLIVDELGYVPLSTGSELLFEIFSQRYERASDAGDLEPALPRVDGDLRLGAADRRLAGSSHPPRPYRGDERRKLSSPAEQGFAEALFLRLIPSAWPPAVSGGFHYVRGRLSRRPLTAFQPPKQPLCSTSHLS